MVSMDRTLLSVNYDQSIHYMDSMIIVSIWSVYYGWYMVSILKFAYGQYTIVSIRSVQAITIRSHDTYMMLRDLHKHSRYCYSNSKNARATVQVNSHSL